MRNCILTITGQKGSGKTSLAKHLVKLCSRVIVIDRMVEYDGEVFNDFESAIDYLAVTWHGDCQAVVRFDNDLYYRELFRFLFYTASRCPTKPTSVIVEEADFFCSPHAIEPNLEALYKYGRHRHINVASIARGDTDLHRSVLNNSDCIVSFRARKFSRDMRERFTAEELERVQSLETLTPIIEPKAGVHFLTYPPETDPLLVWREAQGLDIAARIDHIDVARRESEANDRQQEPTSTD